MNIIKTNRTALNVTTGVMNVMFQNGVVGGPMHSSPQIAMGSSIDSHNGNVALNDNPKRPNILGVNQTKDYVAKNLRVDSDDLDSGSLPCTPELNGEIDVSSCSAGDEVLESDTRQLISCFLADYTGLTKAQWNESRELSTMKIVVKGLLEKHRYAYNGMVDKLSMEDRWDDTSFVSAVAKSMFADGTTNWGRIASLVTFGAVVSQYLKENGKKDCVEHVAREISTYLLSDQRDWLIKNNAWDGFVEFFRVADPESTVRNTLIAVAGVAGIGAALTMWIR